MFCLHVKSPLPPGNNPIAVNKYYYVARARKRTYNLQSNDMKGANYCHDLGVEDTTSKWGKPSKRKWTAEFG